MLRSFALTLGSMFLASICVSALPSPTVDCDAGQSLNSTLAKMAKFTPATITVKGTCTEFVLVPGAPLLALFEKWAFLKRIGTYSRERNGQFSS
jgi:hypothetical protein